MKSVVGWQFLRLLRAAGLSLLTSAATAQAIHIGHLEATDDDGPSWQYYSCVRTGKTLRCSITQTLFRHETEFDQRESAVQKELTESSAATARAQLANACKEFPLLRDMLEKQIAIGKKVNGARIAQSEAKDIHDMITNMNAVCLAPTDANLKRVVEGDVDRSLRTCVVMNMHSDEVFNWNDSAHAWESRSAETGPCGSVVETRLMSDPKQPNFWIAEERHSYRNRAGTLPTGQSCALLPADRTYHFTWRAAVNSLDCTYVKNSMM